MEFHEKLQELRKQRGLTQEELAEALYVSRTAISKWESGRGYPNIDSLKEISNFFSVSIDDLLSSEKMLFIAEKEHKTNLQSMFDLLLGIVDICSFLLIVLPLYPKTAGEYIYSVNLIEYTQNNVIIRMIFWLFFVAVIAVGVIKNLLVQLKVAKGQKALTFLSMGLSIFIVVFLALTREVYAVVVAFLLLVIKGLLLVRYREIM